MAGCESKSEGQSGFAKGPRTGYPALAMKLFYTGPVINTEMLVLMLEKNGIAGKEELIDVDGDPNDLSRQAKVFVPEADYQRAYDLFYGEKEGEL